MRDPVAMATPVGEERLALPGPGMPGMVSVVIPTYERAEVVRGAIESVLAQTYAHVEVIVVDDGSRDDTRRVVESYGPRVRYLFQENAGVSAARNTGFAAARGEFIALLDSDDRFLPWKLAAQVEVLRRHPEVGMVWTDMSAVSEQGEMLEERHLRTFYDAHEVARLEDVFTHLGPLADTWPDAPAAVATTPVFKGEIFSQMLLGNLVHTSTVVLRRDRLRQVGPFDTSLKKSGEDYEFHIRTCSYGPVAFIDAPSLLYRVGAADQLTSPRLSIFRARNNLTTVLRWFERGGTHVHLSPEMVAWRLAQVFAWAGEAELEAGNSSVARRYLLKSLRYDPRDRRAAALMLFTMLPRPALTGARRAKRMVARLRRTAGHVFTRAPLIAILALSVSASATRPAALEAGAPPSSGAARTPTRYMRRLRHRTPARVAARSATRQAGVARRRARTIPFPQ